MDASQLHPSPQAGTPIPHPETPLCQLNALVVTLAAVLLPLGQRLQRVVVQQRGEDWAVNHRRWLLLVHSILPLKPFFPSVGESCPTLQVLRSLPSPSISRAHPSTLPKPRFVIVSLDTFVLTALPAHYIQALLCSLLIMQLINCTITESADCTTTDCAKLH